MTKQLPRVQLAALPLAVLAALPSHAQNQPQIVAQLAETVVTATRVETRSDAVLSDVVVIDADTLAASTGRTLTEVLSRSAGLQFSANGGLGKQSGLFIRGTESRHVLLLIDGVRYGSSTAGAAVFDNLPLSAIDRIEVLKGPASALYGSDAVGGVVQVFTKQGAKGFQPFASATLGSYGHRAASAGLSGGTDAVTYALSLGKVRENGFSATNENVAFGNHNPDDDGFDQDTVSGSLRWAFAPGWSTRVHFLNAEGTSEFDQGPAAFNVRSDNVSRVAGWGVERQWSADSRTQLKLSRSEDRAASITEYATDHFNTTQTQATLQHDWNTVVGNVVVGLESIKEEVSGTQAYAVHSRTTRAAFAGLHGQSGAHFWQVNLRRDRNSQFGDANTGFASYGYQITPNWRPHVAYGTSFKAPSFNTLYYVSPFFNGNPSTQPERGKNSEVGLTYTSGLHEVKLTRFDNRVRGFITREPEVTNVPRVRMEGWSLGYMGGAGNWSWGAHWERLDARNEANNLKLVRRADDTLTASLEHRQGAWTLGGSLLAVGGRFDNAANTDRLSGFATADLFAAYQVQRDWSVKLRVNNLSDKFYETARGYNQPGRAAYLTLDWQPRR